MLRVSLSTRCTSICSSTILRLPTKTRLLSASWHLLYRWAFAAPLPPQFCESDTPTRSAGARPNRRAVCIEGCLLACLLVVKSLVHFSISACHHCAGAMLIISVSFPILSEDVRRESTLSFCRASLSQSLSLSLSRAFPCTG